MKQGEKVENLLNGGRYSTCEISRILYIADPRKVISILRERGVKVSDVWRKTASGARYKEYFIK